MTKYLTKAKASKEGSKEGSSHGTDSVPEYKSLLLSSASQNCNTSAKDTSHYVASAEDSSPLPGPSHREDMMYAKAMTTSYTVREHSERISFFIFKWYSSPYNTFLCFDA